MKQSMGPIVLLVGFLLTAGCGGGGTVRENGDNHGTNGAAPPGQYASVEIGQDELEQVHFANVWSPVVQLNNVRIEQAWLEANNVYVTASVRGGHQLLKIDGESGLVVWSFDLEFGRLEFRPSVYRYPTELRSSNPDELFLVQNDTVYVLDDIEGAETYRIPCKFPVSTSVTASEDYVFVGSWNKRMYALSKSKRLEQWSYVTEAPLTAAAETGEVNLFFGSEDNQVYCLNQGAGYVPGKSWVQPTGGKIVVSPLFDAGRVFVGSWDYKVYCFNVYQGLERWSYPTGAPVVGRIFPFGDNLFVTSLSEDSGRRRYSLVALDRNEGRPKWQRQECQRVVAADPFHCYALGQDGLLHALRLEDGKPAWSLDVRRFKFVLTQDADRGRRRDLWGRIYLVSESGAVQAIRPRR